MPDFLLTIDKDDNRSGWMGIWAPQHGIVELPQEDTSAGERNFPRRRIDKLEPPGGIPIASMFSGIL